LLADKTEWNVIDFVPLGNRFISGCSIKAKLTLEVNNLLAVQNDKNTQHLSAFLTVILIFNLYSLVSLSQMSSKCNCQNNLSINAKIYGDTKIAIPFSSHGEQS